MGLTSRQAAVTKLARAQNGVTSAAGEKLPLIHQCHAHGCLAVIPPEKLFCVEHWFMVPPPLRRRVLRSYTPGQCRDRSKIKPEWISAASEAVEYLATPRTTS